MSSVAKIGEAVPGEVFDELIERHGRTSEGAVLLAQMAIDYLKDVSSNNEIRDASRQCKVSVEMTKRVMRILNLCAQRLERTA